MEQSKSEETHSIILKLWIISIHIQMHSVMTYFFSKCFNFSFCKATRAKEYHSSSRTDATAILSPIENPTLKWAAPAKQMETMISGRIQSILSNCPTEDLHKYKQMQFSLKTVIIMCLTHTSSVSMKKEVILSTFTAGMELNASTKLTTSRGKGLYRKIFYA